MQIIETVPPAASRILIIDDNPRVHEAFDGILQSDPASKTLEEDDALMFGDQAANVIRKPNYDIDHAMSGQDGINKVRQAVQAGRPYQVAFVDIRMPGIDGVETIRQFWQVDPRVQTVICTAYADYRWEDLAKQLGQTDRLLILKKPFHNIEVLQMASTLSQKWYLEKRAELKLEQMESLVARRTQKLFESHQREHQRIRELDQSKLHYLLRLARDFCGPLTLIAGPVDKLVSGVALNRTEIGLLHKNVQALLHLLKNSFLMRQLDPDDLKLDIQELELVGFVKGLLFSFSTDAGARKVQLQFECKPEMHRVWMDADKLERILFHLLACALQSVADQSRILVRLDFEPGAQMITLEMDHCPEPKLRIPLNSSWSGLTNLSLQEITILFCQQMLGVLQGELQIEEIPPRDGRKSGGLKMNLRIPEIQPAGRQSLANDVSNGTFTVVREGGHKDQPLILLLEKNGDFKIHITQGLGEEFRFSAAANVEAILSIARDSVPDLIIIDLDQSGQEVFGICTELKHNQITSHIPIILLGAGVTDSMRLDALKTGVDDFLAKPFRLPLLKARVENLLEKQRKMHQHFLKSQVIPPQEMVSNAVDAEFLRRVVEVVDRNLCDFEFDVEALAHQLALSRRQLYRKFDALAGCTPSSYIREIRLKHAAQLLRDSSMAVSEIIYAVGFTDLNHFRILFRERFGMLPGEYSKHSRERPSSPVSSE